uniref:Putative camp-dependent protein kinase catalytic subunit n=1 Tax=Rhodnius prolixus TaxID=13249 RepID=R4FM40_RHOPR
MEKTTSAVQDSDDDFSDKTPASVDDSKEKKSLTQTDKGIFDDWLKTNVPQRKFKTEKKNKYSDELLKDILNTDGKEVKTWRDYLDKAKAAFEKRMLNTQMPLIKKTEFDFMKTIGTGAFSKVLLVRHIETKTFYAAKLLTKSVLVRDRHVQHARNEKLILQSIRFVFTIHMEFFFQDNVYLFFIMTLVPGGELFSYLTKVNRLKEEHARFYAAQIVLAFEYLHYLGLIFRDLKPENILIDANGYLKLADFGFCKAIELRTYTFCGTAEYLAPEMLSCRGYGKSVDWWTFGVFLYELTAGYTPFYSKLQAKTYDNISRCKYKIPYHFSSDLRDLIRSILLLDLTRRFGNLKNGVDDIKDHKFFSSMPWTMLLNREVKAPYIPVITRPDDTSHFERFVEKPQQTSAVDLYKKEFADF